MAASLADIYPGSAHVHECGLGSADDEAVWDYAKKNGFTIVTKDTDFQEYSVLRGAPPKVVWLRVTNCATQEIESLLRTALPVVTRFIREDLESCLVLGTRLKTK